MSQPNVVFLHSHNTGRYVQPYGHAVPTPNLQRLAQQGVLFRNAFAAAPTCSPSRSSFLTGQYPHKSGMLGLAHRGFQLHDVKTHIVHTLKGNGYYTALSGVEHTVPDAADVGYDAILSSLDTNYPSTGNEREPAEAAVEFLKDKPAQPFFLSLGLNETHRPFPVPDPEHYAAEDVRYSQPPRPLPDTPELRAEMVAFKAAARVMDDAFGRVLDTLEEYGLSRNTLVFCFSDHGLQFPRNMCNLTDHGIGVYMIVRGPHGFGGGKVIDAMVSLLDLFPTVCEVADISLPAWLDGLSIVPLVNGSADCIHEEIYAQINYHAAYEPTRCVRNRRYKYIRRFDNRNMLVLPNVDDTPTKDFLLEHNWKCQPRPQELLHDLIFDPDETTNVIDRPDMAPVLTGLRMSLGRWMHETSDPLLTGNVPGAPGAQINDPDQRSPKDPKTTICH